jgi:predicted MPP superfamily phosphohydrolase
MRIYLPIILSFILGTLLAAGAKKLLSLFLEKFWAKKLPTIKFRIIILFFFIIAFLWAVGRVFDMRPLMIAGASMMAILNLTSLVLALILPWPLLINFIGARIRKPSTAQVPANMERRHFIKIAASALPAMALGTVGSGMAGSFQPVKINKVPMYFSNLPDDLDGFTILHLSDLHLGYYFHVSDLEETLKEAEAYAPDLVLVTGDVADDLNQLPDALKLIAQLKATHGAYMSLGNHEYIRSINDVRRIVSAGHVTLLVDAGHRIMHGNENIYIGGADDPRRMRGDVDPFLDQTIEKAMAKSKTNDFKLLMSHRPKALDVAGKHGVDLIFGGHTHGGQIMLDGKSLFEGMVEREPYLWGKYKKGKTQLYTSAGMGHWFPFRLNCPPEAPLIELKKV